MKNVFLMWHLILVIPSTTKQESKYCSTYHTPQLLIRITFTKIQHSSKVLMLMYFFIWLNNFNNSVFKAGISHPLLSNGVLNYSIVISMCLSTNENKWCSSSLLLFSHQEDSLRTISWTTDSPLTHNCVFNNVDTLSCRLLVC